MEEETIKATQIIEDQLYWTTDEIKNGKDIIFGLRVSKKKIGGIAKKI